MEKRQAERQEMLERQQGKPHGSSVDHGKNIGKKTGKKQKR